MEEPANIFVAPGRANIPVFQYPTGNAYGKAGYLWPGPEDQVFDVGIKIPCPVSGRVVSEYSVKRKGDSAKRGKKLIENRGERR